MPAHPDVSSELIDSAQSCSESAENALFQLLRARILRLVQKRLCSQKREQAKTPEDIVQEVFVVICDKGEKTEVRRYKTIARDRFMPWVFMIARNKIGDDLRKLLAKLFDGLPEKFTGSTENAEQQLTEDEIDRIICNALRGLNPRCKQTVRVLFRQSQGYDLPEEIAKLPKTTWYPRVHHCRKQFRSQLRKEGLDI